MELKDYYSLLELQPSANLAEIKKNYRRLALQYHPDKNPDPYANAQFAAIKEAYDVLTNPTKKEYYLQQRWYHQSTGRRMKEQIITPVTVLKQALELNKYVSMLDVHRMDKEGLYAYINNMVKDEIIEKLNQFNDLSINKEITHALLHCSRVLPISLSIALNKRLALINNDQATKKEIEAYNQLNQKIVNWERYRPWLILLAVILLCLVIFFST